MAYGVHLASDYGTIPDPPPPPPSAPVLVSSSDVDGDRVTFNVRAQANAPGASIASFAWSGEGRNDMTQPAAGDAASIVVETGRARGETARIAVSATDTLGVASPSAEFSHLLVAYPALAHGQVLYNAANEPVAVVTGSYQSGGREPWNIFGRRVWIAVATANLRGPDSFGWGSTTPQGLLTTTVTSGRLASSNTAADGTGNYVSSLTSEANMDAAFPNDRNQDSRRKTDILLQGGHPASYPPDAANRCRAIVPIVNGVPTPMDLPRISALMRIYQARGLVDAIDPSLAAGAANLTANKGKALAQWKLHYSMWGSTYYAWSATVMGNSSGAFNGDVFVIMNIGGITTQSSSKSCGTIPALELPA